MMNCLGYKFAWIESVDIWRILKWNHTLFSWYLRRELHGFFKCTTANSRLIFTLWLTVIQQWSWIMFSPRKSQSIELLGLISPFSRLVPKTDDCSRSPSHLLVFCYVPSWNVKVFRLVFFFFTTNALWQRRRQQCDELLVKVLNDLHHITPSCCRLEFWPLSPDCHCSKPQMGDCGRGWNEGG